MAARDNRTSSTYRFGAWRSRHGIVALALLFAFPALTRSLAAQQTDWSAMLQIQPYPSPYLSDWEANPNIATLTLVNPTTSSDDVVLRYDIHNQQGALLASGRSDPQTIPAGSPTIYTSFVDIEGSSQHDPTLENEMTTTGRIPEGVYTVCVVAANAQNLVLARTCEQFTIVYPDPPMLISPADGAVVSTTSPMFQWTPLQVPAEFQLRYILQIAEVHQGQTAAAALAANIPLYENRDVGSTVLEYPLDAQPFEQGKTYAWRVMTLDQNGYPPSTNGGMSEIQTFQYDDGSTPLPPPANSLVTFSLTNSDADSGSAADSPTDTLTLRTICKNWDVPSQTPIHFGFAVNSRWSFHPFSKKAAELYRDTTKTQLRPWWIYAATDKRQFLVHGECGGEVLQTRPMGGLEWIVIKRSDYKTLGQWLIGRNPSNENLPLVGDTLQYGAWAFALRSDSLWVDPKHSFYNFFGSNSFSVKPGLNAFAVIALKNGRFWPFFHALGYDQKHVTLTGFAGLDLNATLGIGSPTSGGGSVDQSLQATGLLLTFAFPDRKPLPGHLFYPIAKSMHVGLELEVKDSLAFRSGGEHTATDAGTGVNGSNTLEIVPKITHTIELRDDVAKHIQGSRQLVGQLQLDIQGGSEHTAQPSKTQSKLKQIWSKVSGPRLGAAFGVKASDVPCASTTKGIEWKADYVVSYGLDGKVVLGPVYLDSPGFEVHIDVKHRKEWSIALATEVGFNKLNYGAILGLAVAPKATPDANEHVVATREFADKSTCTSITRPRSNAIAEGSDTTVSAGRPRSNAIGNASDTTAYNTRGENAPPTGRARSNAFSESSDSTSAASGTGAKKASWRDKFNVYWKVAFPENLDLVSAMKTLGALIEGAIQNLGGAL